MYEDSMYIVIWFYLDIFVLRMKVVVWSAVENFEINLPSLFKIHSSFPHINISNPRDYTFIHKLNKKHDIRK